MADPAGRQTIVPRATGWRRGAVREALPVVAIFALLGPPIGFLVALPVSFGLAGLLLYAPWTIYAMGAPPALATGFFAAWHRFVAPTGGRYIAACTAVGALFGALWSVMLAGGNPSNVLPVLFVLALPGAIAAAILGACTRPRRIRAVPSGDGFDSARWTGRR